MITGQQHNVINVVHDQEEQQTWPNGRLQHANEKYHTCTQHGSRHVNSGKGQKPVTGRLNQSIPTGTHGGGEDHGEVVPRENGARNGGGGGSPRRKKKAKVVKRAGKWVGLLPGEPGYDEH